MGTTIDGRLLRPMPRRRTSSRPAADDINLGGISSHVGAWAGARDHAKAGMVGLTRALSKELAGNTSRENRRAGLDRDRARLSRRRNHGAPRCPTVRSRAAGRRDRAMVRFLCSMRRATSPARRSM